MSGVVLSVIVLGSYFVFRGGGTAEATYVLATVTKGTIISSITGSGQVAASQQIDVKPKASGTLTYVGVKTGQQVYRGQILAYLDAREAQRSVRDAQISLESAQISLEKMQRNQQVSSETTVESLEQSYRDAYNKVSDAFLDLPNVVELARGVLYDNTVSPAGGCGNVCEYGNLAGQDFRDELRSLTSRSESDYKIAKDAFDPNFTTYRSLRFDASPEEVTAVLKTTEKTTELIAQAVKSEQNMLDALVSNMKSEASKQGDTARIPQQVTTYQNSIGSALSNLNSILSSLGNARRAIESSQRSLDDTQLTNPIDMRSQENTVAQRKAALQDAQANLANYVIRAPFAGIVAKSEMKAGDSVSGSTVIATLLTKQSIAQISLNEVEIAQVKIGQKVTLTFDAVEELTITGNVVEVDPLGTVSQGVVTYGVSIGFDTQDERVKPGMSASAAVITGAKQDVLLVPNSAVKSSGETRYVEMPGDVAAASQLVASAMNASGVALGTPPQRKLVEVGLVNDSVSEVMGGLNEGDIVVVRTVTTSSATTQTNSLFPVGGGTGGGSRGGLQVR